MQKIINDLVQLQDLVAARAEQEASMPGARLADLDHSIRTMLKQLPEDMSRQFVRLKNKELLGIVPIYNKTCTGCGMQLPISFVQQVRALEDVYPCPNCARLLYFTDSLPKRVAQKKSRFDAPKVGIERFSSPQLMLPKLKATNCEEAIQGMCHHMDEAGFVEHPDQLIEEALKREAIVSTAVDNGLAFPHVRGVEGGGLSLMLALNKRGIRFGHPGGKLTRVIFFMIIPTAASAFYLKLLSGLTTVFRDKENRDKLFAADSPETLWKILLKTTRRVIP